MVTRQHSSRMRIAHLPTILALVAATRCQYWWGRVGPQVNKFEQVSHDNHQMSVARGRGLGPRSDVGGDPLSDLSHDACDVPTPFSPPVNRQTPMKTLPSGNMLGGGGAEASKMVR